MVFTEFTTLVRSQWLLLRGAFDSEGHERRVQERLDKKQAKQQQKAARRAARQARRAHRKQPPPMIIVEPAEPPKPRYSRPGGLSVPVGASGLAWAQTTEALAQVSGNDDGARFFQSESNGEGRDTPQVPQDASSEYVDQLHEENAEAATSADVLTQLPMELSFELDAQLEQKQREFYDSLGGYSTVDEEDDELHELHEQLDMDRGIRETKLPAKWTVVGIKKAIGAQPKEGAFLKLSEAPEEEEDASLSADTPLVASGKNPRVKSLSNSEELVETEPEDDDVDLRDSDSLDSYSTFDVLEARDVLVVDHELDGSRPPPISFRSCADPEVPTEELEVKADTSFAERGPELKTKVEVEEKSTINDMLTIDLNDDRIPGVSASLEELEELPMIHTHVAESEVMEGGDSLDLVDKLRSEEITKAECEEGVTANEAVEEIIEEMVQKKAEVAEEMHPTDEDMFGQPTSLPASPVQMPLTVCVATPGLYSPGSVDEYACAIYENLRAREHRYHVTEDIYNDQKSVSPKMRSVLVDWLVEVHQRFELEAQTLYLTINYVDRYLAQAPVSPQRFQLIGVAALLIASKFEEIYPCDMDDLLYICERSYSKADLVECERSMLNVFKFNLAVPTASSFLSYYVDHFEDDELVGQLANYFSERSLLDFAFGATYEPSIVACSCLLAAYSYVENQTPALVWNYRLVELTGYAVEAILPCTRDLWPILIQQSDLVAVATKYSAKELGEVAHLPLEDLEALL
ncbi:hypothetical protein PHYBOEH_009029 [Phytophthora boehmeriae]|uniref:Cyclin N-terminal domain-containing protein n=1 Tax=Phytophthora boehmeriae TaxID=109152 RepID=A0A8T1WZM4_9STRA|nr:hypothetical protein PHYBOEH_009029 [Phytophthora boehmeriae]